MSRKTEPTITNAGKQPIRAVSIFESVIKVSYRSSSDSDEIDTGKIKRVADNTWILNPKSNFPIKISNVNIETAKELKIVLDKCIIEEAYNNRKLVAGLILRHSIMWEDLEDFLKEHKTVYLNTIDGMKTDSTEWSISSELDKKDLLKEFEEKALEKLKIRLSIDEELLYSDILPISENRKYG